MNKVEVAGFIGLFFLTLSMFQMELLNVRIFGIIASTFYLIQSILLKEKSLVITNLMLVIVAAIVILQLL